MLSKAPESVGIGEQVDMCEGPSGLVELGESPGTPTLPQCTRRWDQPCNSRGLQKRGYVVCGMAKRGLGKHKAAVVPKGRAVLSR